MGRKRDGNGQKMCCTGHEKGKARKCGEARVGEIQMRLDDFSMRNIKITQQKSIRKSGFS